MDRVIIIICSLFASIVLIINIFLLVLMMRFTPKSFANFGILMKFQVISDILTILAAAAAMVRIVPINNSFVYISHGPCTLVSSTACFVSYGLVAMGGSMTLYIVLASFIVRLRIVRNKPPSDRSILLLLCALSFPVPTVILVLFVCSRSDDSTMRSILLQHLPQYATIGAVISGTADIRTPTMTTALVLMIANIIPLYILILIIRSTILKCLEETGKFISEKTKAMHSQFMLSLQCAIPPVVFVVTLLPFKLEHWDVIRNPIVEAMINMVACLSTLLSPLIVLFHIVPYRRATVRLIHELSSLTSGNREILL